jgi:hypothetical protein
MSSTFLGMLRNSFGVPALAALIVLLASCESQKSSNPLSPAIAGPIAGVSIQAPKPVAPAASSQIATDQQPVTLTIDNAATNGVRPLSYDFEVASDAAFGTKIFSKAGVEPGTNGQTSVRLADSLAPEHTYYWRAKADDGANASGYSPVTSFLVFTPVVIQPPVQRAPADGATLMTRRPTLTVTNAQRTGPAGKIQYVFEIATDQAVANKVATALVAEGTDQTSYMPPDDLAYATQYYWRVQAQDPGHASNYSLVQSFRTPAAPVVVVPPAPVPVPAPGPVAGDGINMFQATIMNSPLDLAQWAVTTSITRLELRPSGVHVEFTKRDGAGRWPDVLPPGWSGPLEYTLGMCMNVGGQWYCSAVIEFWNGLDEAGGGPSGYATNWFYDPIRWGPMSGHQPAPGETIGFFVCEGDCRNNTMGTSSPLRERSNIVLVPMPSGGGATYTF